MIKIVVKYQITSSLKKRLWWCDKPEKINVDKSKYLWLKCIKKKKRRWSTKFQRISNSQLAYQYLINSKTLRYAKKNPLNYVQSCTMYLTLLRKIIVLGYNHYHTLYFTPLITVTCALFFGASCALFFGASFRSGQVHVQAAAQKQQATTRTKTPHRLYITMIYQNAKLKAIGWQ